MRTGMLPPNDPWQEFLAEILARRLLATGSTEVTGRLRFRWTVAR